MSYKDDKLFNNNEKIPFDDSPIARKPSKNSSPFKGNGQNKSFFQNSKLLVAVVVILFTLNVILMGVCGWAIRNGGTKNINVLNPSILTASEDGAISSYAMNKAYYSSVCIAAGSRVTNFNDFFNKSGLSRGTGVIIEKNEKELYVLTCFHVIDGYYSKEGDSKINVLYPSSLEPISSNYVEVVGYSTTNDIVVLKVKNLKNAEPCTEVENAKVSVLNPSDAVFTIGNAISSNLKFTKGTISSINENVLIEKQRFREIVFSAAIQPGNSGGGLFNNKGEFVGLVNAKLPSVTSNGTTIPVELTSYALPGFYAIGIGKSIILNGGKPKGINIGAEFENDKNSPVSSGIIEDKSFSQFFNQIYSVKVSSVESHSSSSGKLKVNDKIISFTYESIIDGQRHKVYMVNQYCFEDVKFLIKKDSEIIFEVERKKGILGTEVETQSISIFATETFTPE